MYLLECFDYSCNSPLALALAALAPLRCRNYLGARQGREREKRFVCLVL